MTTVILACHTLEGELMNALKEAKSDMPVFFMPKQVHDDPKFLHSFVQDKLDNFANVDRIVVCTTGCGGGTLGLKATNCEMVIPKTKDCLDILLSTGPDCKVERPLHSIFLTKSWAEFMQNSLIDLRRQIEEKGQEEAEAFIRKVYGDFKNFYIIDTGAYDIEPVREYLMPLVKVLDGTLEVIKGEYSVLRKIAANDIDEEHFWIVKKGDSLPMDAFKKPAVL